MDGGAPITMRLYKELTDIQVTTSFSIFLNILHLHIMTISYFANINNLTFVYTSQLYNVDKDYIETMSH